MKTIHHLKLAIGFGLISSISFGQTTEKKEGVEKKEVKTVPTTTPAPPTPTPTPSPSPVSTDKNSYPKREERVKVQEVHSVQKVEEKEDMEELSEKPVEVKTPAKVKPVEIPVSVPVKVKPPLN